MITATCVLAVKSDEDKEERYKIRYVAGGHLDVMKDYLFHCARIIQCVSARILLVIAKAKRCSSWVVDVRLEYFQSDKPIIRNDLPHKSCIHI